MYQDSSCEVLWLRLRGKQVAERKYRPYMETERLTRKIDHIRTFIGLHVTLSKNLINETHGPFWSITCIMLGSCFYSLMPSIVKIM